MRATAVLSSPGYQDSHAGHRTCCKKPAFPADVITTLLVEDLGVVESIKREGFWDMVMSGSLHLRTIDCSPFRH